MKVKVKVEEKKVVVFDKNDEPIYSWSKAIVEEMGGLENCLERCKKMYPKVEIEIIESTPASTTVAP
jgi:hypothetical protein